jgi:DNA repair protein SbcD/Mre11
MTGAADFCFVHAADLHLGGRRWLRSPPPDSELAERIRHADRLALSALIDLCLAEHASLLLCSGDIIDGWCRDHRVGLGLQHELLRLRDAACEVALLLGNHDARTRVIRPLPLPEHAWVLGIGGPETRLISRLGVALHGWSFPAPEAPTDIAALYPAPLPDLLNIGLLHTSAEGRHGHVDYAPCSRRTLRRHGYAYWALGHVHAREVIAQDPWVVFPGNLQARGARETGPKGAMVVRVRGGRITSVAHHAVDALRFETVIVDTEGAQHFDDVLAAAHDALVQVLEGADGRPVVARLVLRGVEGTARALGLPATQRARALAAVARGVLGRSVWLDEAWIDAGEHAGAWRIETAA